MRIFPLRAVPVLLAFVLSASACGGSDSDPDQTVGGGSDGRVTSDDGRLGLSGPPELDLSGVTATATEPEFIYGNDVVELELLGHYELEPSGRTFAEPLTMTFTVTDPSVAGLSPSAFVVLSDSEEFGLEVLDAEVVVAGDTVTATAEVQHFSFAIVGRMLSTRIQDPDARIDPQFWEMAVGETWEPPVVVDVRRGLFRTGTTAVNDAPFFEFQAITTDTPLVAVADTQVRCAEPGEGELVVRGMLRIPLRRFVASTRQALEGEADRRGEVVRPVDAGATVECLPGGSSFSEDDDSEEADDGEPTQLEKTDEQCLDSTGSPSIGCTMMDLSVDYRSLALTAADLDAAIDDVLRGSMNLNSAPSNGYFLGLGCDTLQPETFQPAGPDEQVPCRLTLFDGGGVGDTILVDSPPSVRTKGDVLDIDLDGGLLDRDGLRIPPGLETVGGMPVPPGSYPIDTASFSIRNPDGSFSVATVDPQALLDAAFQMGN